MVAPLEDFYFFSSSPHGISGARPDWPLGFWSSFSCSVWSGGQPEGEHWLVANFSWKLLCTWVFLTKVKSMCIISTLSVALLQRGHSPRYKHHVVIFIHFSVKINPISWMYPRLPVVKVQKHLRRWLRVELQFPCHRIGLNTYVNVKFQGFSFFL